MAFVTTQQLKDKAAKRRLAAKKTGSEIFVTLLPAVNVSVSAVKVFIVVLIICCHSDNFMMSNETLVYCLLLLPPFHNFSLFDAKTHGIHSFQETKAVRMERTSDGIVLKSPFADQVLHFVSN